MSSYSTTLGQWIDHIRYEIRNLASASKHVFVHRALLTLVFNSLRSFSNALKSRVGDSRVLDADEVKCFEKMISVLSSIKELVIQQYETNWLGFFLEHSLTFVPDQILALCDTFNEMVLKVKLSDTPPIPRRDAQEKGEMVHDFVILQQLLENMNTVDYADLISRIKHLREELAKEAGIELEAKKPKALEASVIAESLSKFDKWEVDNDDLELQKRIGSGGFADVFLGYRKSDGTIVAVKKLHQQQFDENMLESFKREVAILAGLKHFAILPFVGACTKPPYCIITEFMPGGSLFSRIHTKEPSEKLDATQLSIIALGIAYGMSYLHDQQMLHRDLKSLNILLDAEDYPKICDFGMARTKSTGSDEMTGGIGTSQWMAPEVLVSQRYDEKADVYSYGIILWEMLTGDIPYRGLRDIQVAMTVINQNNRPKIPKNCPQNLAKFIRICWHTDPDKRPPFKTIIRALESGAIAFPGTDISKLKAYAEQFAQTSDQIDEEYQLPVNIDPNSVTEEQLQSYIDNMKTDETAVSKLVAAVANQEVISMIAQLDIIPVLIEQISTCSDSHKIAHLVELLAVLLTEDTMRASFLELNGESVLLDLLHRFSTSMMSKLIECFLAVISFGRCVFTKAHISRIAPFLICADMAVRQQAITLLSGIADNVCYEDESIFEAAVQNLLRNLIPEAKNDLLLMSLNLLIRLTEFEGAKAQLRCVDGPDRICCLLEHNDLTILATVLRLMQVLFNGTASKQRTISSFLGQFPSILARCDSDGQIEAFNALTILMSNPIVYREVAACKSFATSFSPCIESSDIAVQVSALRMCFVFCANPTTADGFIVLLPQLLDMLIGPTHAAILASFSVTALLSMNDPVEAIGDKQDVVHAFFNRALALESELTGPAVRLVGVMAGKLSGANLLEEWDIMTYITALLKSDDDELKHLVLMAMTSMSAATPNSPMMYNSLPLLIGACNDPSYGAYPLICLSNITVDPAIASACVEFLPDLFGFMRSADPIAVQRAIVSVQRVLLTPESLEMMKEEARIDEFFDATSALWGGENDTLLYDIVEILSAQRDICRLLKKKNMVTMVRNKLSMCKMDDPDRPKFLRIRSRLLAIKD